MFRKLHAQEFTTKFMEHTEILLAFLSELGVFRGDKTLTLRLPDCKKILNRRRPPCGKMVYSRYAQI